MTATALPTQATQLSVSHASGLHAVNRMLAQMHHEILRSSGAAGGAVRLSVVNLVAACTGPEWADVAARAVSAVGVKHPARAIIVVADAERAPGIEADLSLPCTDTRSGRLCIEKVQLQVSGAAALHLASVVTPLLVPDIPVFLWLVGSPPIQQAFGQDAIALCERVIIDTGAYEDAESTMRTLATEVRAAGDAISLCDMAWERFRPWRQLIANAFDGVEMRGFVHGIDHVEITSSGDSPGSQAWLTAGWLASRLDWGTGGPVLDVVADGTSGGHDLVRVVLRCRRGRSTATVAVQCGDGMLHAVIDVDGGMRAERAMRYMRGEPVHLVSRLIEQVTEDPVYRPALAGGATLVAERAQ